MTIYIYDYLCLFWIQRHPNDPQCRQMLHTFTWKCPTGCVMTSKSGTRRSPTWLGGWLCGLAMTLGLKSHEPPCKKNGLKVELISPCSVSVWWGFIAFQRGSGRVEEPRLPSALWRMGTPTGLIPLLTEAPIGLIPMGFPFGWNECPCSLKASIKRLITNTHVPVEKVCHVMSYVPVDSSTAVGGVQ